MNLFKHSNQTYKIPAGSTLYKQDIDEEEKFNPDPFCKFKDCLTCIDNDICSLSKRVHREMIVFTFYAPEARRINDKLKPSMQEEQRFADPTGKSDREKYIKPINIHRKMVISRFS